MITESPRLSAALADRYTIERELGAGGMATVYLAHDIKHDRKVAVKVLRPELAAVIGAERFLAEIKTTANLQHPHILPLFDSGVTESFLYYVMPYVEGISLRDRMSREKQLPISEAVRITSEVASALDYAHRHGVIHRDIKPENILLHDGSALVADFGIALAASKAGTRMTETGMSLGTPSYMSPEQAMGERDLDARSDVYALGCVAYEMLTGEPPFSGPTAQAIVAKVMTSEPVMATSLRKTIPPHVSEAVHTALEKLPADRFATAAEFATAIGDASMSLRPRQANPVAKRSPLGWMPIAALTIVVLAAGLAIGRASVGKATETSDVIAASFDLGDSAKVRPVGNLRLAVSPKGNRIVFVGTQGAEAVLWVREFNQPTARLLPDTKGAFAPFFSPDGESIGYFTALAGKVTMKVIPANGGVPRIVLEDSIASFGGASWGDDGNIYFTNSARAITRVSANGGTITVLARPDSAHSIRELDFPDVLPGSKLALVMMWHGSVGTNTIGVVNLKDGSVTTIAPGSFARFMAPDYVVIGASNGHVLVGRLDQSTGKLRAPAVLAFQDVQDETSNGTVQFGVAGNGTFVYQRKVGSDVGVVWVDRTGAMKRVDSSLTGNFQSPALSPDGNSIALAVNTPSGTQIWVKQLVNGSFTQLSGEVKEADRPVWTPDGHSIAFLALSNARRVAWTRRADGSNKPSEMFNKQVALDEIQFDKSGRYSIFRSEGSGQGSRHLLRFERGVDSLPRTLINEKYDTYAISLSPDGHWLAYVSEESGAREVYVRPFPNVESAKFAVSVNGGIEPLWRRDGGELFFRNARGDMYAVQTAIGATFSHGPPKLLFSRPGLTVADFYRNYDVSLDGKRFLMLDGGGGETSALNVVFNWRKQLDQLGKVTK